MTEFRRDPEKLLRLARQEEKQGGRLKIFFGYAAGVGKTYAMLEAAHKAKEAGVDVAAGYIEPHARPETMALLDGLEQLAPRELSHQNILLREFDLDGAIARRPQLILVDELAHTNAPGSRHEKRYQDIEELLKAGIDVYSTVNVQHIESLNDTVASITGIIVRERIPDFIFDQADQVALVDMEPQELLDRMREGKIYQNAQAQKALHSFFTLENLTALREIALRRTADRVNRIGEQSRPPGKEDFITREHILICLSPSPSNPKVIRAAAKMAAAFRAKFTALFVETPDFSNMEQKDLQRLRTNLHLAEQLGADTVTSFGSDVVEQIAEYARAAGVSKIVLGRTYTKRSFFSTRESFADRLTRLTPNLEVFLIPDSAGTSYIRPRKGSIPKGVLPDAGKFLAILTGATLLSYLFMSLGFTDTNTVTIYILGVLLTALSTGRQIYSLLSPIASILVFNFFFTDPRFTLSVNNPDYILTFGVMFFSGLLTATLTKKVKNTAKLTAQKAYRTEILLETSQKLQQAHTREEIIESIGNQLTRLLDRKIVFYTEDPSLNKSIRCFPSNQADSALLTEEERGVAAWVYQNNKHAGASTATLPGANCLYLAVRTGEIVFAVVGIDLREGALKAFEEGLMSAVLNECALALNREQLERAKEEADTEFRQEKLRANLLRSISHDLRTPLTSISGNAGILLESGDKLSSQQKHQLYLDTYDDAMWLINLVENLLSVTRIENGTMRLNLQSELAEDVVSEALSHIGRRKAKHVITADLQEEPLLVRMDAKLIIQVILNIIDNAIKYTPPGSHITLSVRQEMENAVFEIADDGPGISDQDKSQLFHMFFTGHSAAADSRRGMGLGLSLCKSIIAAHGGTLSVEDNHPHGAIFRFTLKAEEVHAL